MYDILSEFYDDLVGIDYSVYEDILKDIIKEDDYCLDLACGSGTLLKIMRKYTKNLMGSDLSTEMLLEAQEKNPDISFFTHDLKDDFYVKGLDLITCTVDSINYLLEKADVENLFKNVNDNLKVGGYFVFDIHALSKLETLNDYSYHEVLDDYSYIWDTYVEDDIITHLITFFIKEEDDKYYRYDEEHFQRVYDKTYILSLLKNYEIVEYYTEDRHIFKAKKLY